MFIPEAFVDMGPSRNLEQRLTFEPKNVAAALPRAPDQAGALQNLDVLGDSIQ